MAKRNPKEDQVKKPVQEEQTKKPAQKEEVKEPVVKEEETKLPNDKGMDISKIMQGEEVRDSLRDRILNPVKRPSKDDLQDARIEDLDSKDKEQDFEIALQKLEDENLRSLIADLQRRLRTEESYRSGLDEWVTRYCHWLTGGVVVSLLLSIIKFFA